MRAWAHLWAIGLLLGLAFAAPANPAWGPDSMPNPGLQPAACGRADIQTGHSRVCDPDGVLSGDSRDRVEGIIQSIEAGREPYDMMDCTDDFRTGWKVAVAVVKRMQMAPASNPSDVAEAFATKLHNQWGVGDAACNNGVLLFLAVQDRQVYISTGKGALKSLSNSKVQQVLAKMRSQLRAQHYDEAVEKATVRIGLFLADGQGDESGGSGSNDWALAMAILIMVSFASCSCYSATKRNREYRTCKQLLVKLRRDQHTALRTRQYESTSCPICMEDFAEEDSKSTPSKQAAGSDDDRPEAGKLRPDASETEGSSLLPEEPGANPDAERPASAPEVRKPLVLPCGHRFCDACIAKWLDKSSNITCPVCRKPIREDSDNNRANRDDGSGSSAQPSPPCAPARHDAYDALFVPEARFRMAQLHIRYPYFVSSSMVETWDSEMAHSEIMSTEAQIGSQMTSAAQAAHSQSGSVGASAGFGGGSSFGGGGGGSSW